MSVPNATSAPASPLTQPATSAERAQSPAGARFAGISNRPNVLGGITSGLRSLGRTLQHVFERIQNHLSGAHKQGPAPDARAPERSDSVRATLTLDGAELAYTNTFPKLTALLYLDPAKPAPTCDDVREDFRKLQSGLFGLVEVLKLRPDIVPHDIAQRVETFANPRTVIAGGETVTQVGKRFEQGSLEDDAFLAKDAVRCELLDYMQASRDLAVTFLESAGQPGRASRLAALGQHASTRF